MFPVPMGIPGGPELLVISLTFLLPLAILVYVFYSLGTKASSERVAELERQVGRLDRRVEELENREE